MNKGKQALKTYFERLESAPDDETLRKIAEELVGDPDLLATLRQMMKETLPEVGKRFEVVSTAVWKRLEGSDGVFEVSSEEEALPTTDPSRREIHHV